eukprot:scaffold318586_cov40-Prasinocladus_malaysianus.AAC.1
MQQERPAVDADEPSDAEIWGLIALVLRWLDGYVRDGMAATGERGSLEKLGKRVPAAVWLVDLQDLNSVVLQKIVEDIWPAVAIQVATVVPHTIEAQHPA